MLVFCELFAAPAGGFLAGAFLATPVGAFLAASAGAFFAAVDFRFGVFVFAVPLFFAVMTGQSWMGSYPRFFACFPYSPINELIGELWKDSD